MDRGEPLVKTNGVAEGSDTQITFYSDGEEGFVAKTLVPGASMSTQRAFVNERVIMELFQGMAGVPAAFAIDREDTFLLTDVCAANLLVTKKLGTHTWEDTAFASEEDFFQAAGKSIALLQSLHSTGFVHGDIHGGNFLTDENDPSVLSLIDYGLTTPFVDALGAHLLETDEFEVATILNPANLSPWHLESMYIDYYRPSRRDDMFRLAEMFFKFVCEPYRLEWHRLAIRGTNGWRETSENDWARFKRNYWEFESIDVFRDFYSYTLSLAHDTTPDYGRWIHVFQAASSQWQNTFDAD